MDGRDQRKIMEILTQLKLLNIRNFSCVRLSLDGEAHIIYTAWPEGMVAFGNQTKLIGEELRIAGVLQKSWFTPWEIP
jgi:hypothetical protein